MFYQRRLCVLLLLIITLFSLPFSLFINPYLTIFLALRRETIFIIQNTSGHVQMRKPHPLGFFFAAVDLSYA